jgi:molybdenum cofactor cytidylyltransferase
VNARRFAAIVLAAGLSSRIPQFKPLLPLGGETITDHVISTFLNCGIEVFLVVGHRKDELRAGIKKRDIKIIENPDYRKGMFTSVRAGISRLQPVYQGFFIMPVDIPLVRESTIRRLMGVAAEQSQKVVYPVFGEKRGHPPVIPSSFISPILAWEENGGLKTFLKPREKSALEIPVADSNILFDIDTPQDYTALLERFQHSETPTDEECEAILTSICKVKPDRIRHCKKVSEVAVAIARALNNSGSIADVELVRVAAILHDIAKGQPKHDITGGQILRDLGFSKVGDIVAVHSDLADGNTGLSLEAKIVFLADKFVQGERLVSIEERYSDVSRRYSLTREISNKVNERMYVALKVKEEIERLSGLSLSGKMFEW